MQITLEQDKCVASGQCVMAAMGVFDQRDEDGIAFLLKDRVDGQEIAEVEDAAAVCPALAIHLTETSS